MSKRLRVLFMVAATLCTFVLAGADSLYAAALSDRDAVTIDTLLVKQGLVFKTEAGAEAAAEDFVAYAGISTATLDEWALANEISIDEQLAQKLADYAQSIADGSRTNLSYIEEVYWDSGPTAVYATSAQVSQVQANRRLVWDGPDQDWYTPPSAGQIYAQLRLSRPGYWGHRIEKVYGMERWGLVSGFFDSWVWSTTEPPQKVVFDWSEGDHRTLKIYWNGTLIRTENKSDPYGVRTIIYAGILGVDRSIFVPVNGNIEVDAGILSNPFWDLRGLSISLDPSWATPSSIVEKTAYDVFISNPDGISGLNHDEYRSIWNGLHEGESYIADPIDASSGAHIITRTLLTLHGAQPLGFKLNYNSLLLKEGPVGKGWGHNFETKLAALADGDIDVYWNANRFNRFDNNGDNTFSSQDMATRFDVLVKNPDGSYTLTRKDQSIYEFDASGKLLEQQNGHGQSFILTYDGSGRLTQVKEPVSQAAINLHYDARGLIDAVIDDSGRQVLFGQDEKHNLISIVDAKGQATSFSYNPIGQAISAYDPDGVRVFSNTYDPLGRVAEQDDAVSDNELTGLSYDEKSRPGNLISTVTDRTGETRVLVHDNKHQIISVTDELGNYVSRYTYDDFGNCTSATDADDQVTTFIYDARGNIITVVDSMRNATAFAYDEQNNLLSAENALGNKVTLTYDAGNNVTGVTDSLGNTTTYTYNGDGLPLTKTAPRGGITAFEYLDGRISKVISASGTTSTLGYDTAGRLVSLADAADKKTKFVFDEVDNLLQAIDPLGNTRSFTYGSYHNKLTETDAGGNTTSYSYNGNGSVVRRIDALGGETHYDYDGEDRLTKTTDARGNAMLFGYDAKGRLTRIEDPLGNADLIEYDALDRVVARTDALGNKVLAISHDALGNPLTITDALGRTVTNSYDAIGRLEETIDPMGRTTLFSYDDLNRLVASIDANGSQSNQGFDEDGNLTSLIDPNDNQTVFEFDKAGRLTANASADGIVTGYTYNARDLLERKVNGRGQETRLTYDAIGRLSSIADQAGTIAYTYDANGNVLAVEEGSATLLREYDALNRVTKYIDAYGDTIEYAYDEVGNLVTLTYPGGKKVRYEYDAANRRKKVTDWAGRVTTYDYDANGRLTKTVRPNGTVLTQSYDAAGQLIEQKDIDAGGNTISSFVFTYDAAGNVATEQGAAAEEPFKLKGADMSYSSGNRLATYNGKAVSYDADGNMTEGPLAGSTTAFTYDARNRLTSAGGASYAYDAENNRIGVEEDGVSTYYCVNPNSYLSQVLIKTDAQGGKTYYVYGLGLIGQQGEDGAYSAYHFDRRGNTVAITAEDGTVTDTFRYAPYGELVKRSGQTQTPFLFNGRYGVMTDGNGLNYMRARYYSPEIKRFINRDVLFGNIGDGQSLNRYTYVNGNPISYIDPFGLSREWLDDAQLMLDLAGLVPAVGEFFDITNAGIYLLRGDNLNAGLSASAVVPFVGWAGTGGKYGNKAYRLTEVASQANNYKLTDKVLDNHIIMRHGPLASSKVTSKFAPSFNIKHGIDETLKNADSLIKPNTQGRPGYIFQKNYDQPIGYSGSGRPLYTLKVVVNEAGEVITAYPK